ncbi:MAG: hypothetical protein JWQ09_3288 [Segetibacter sp.]|nr:hypothetical protein [Segetibacter sp.]
MKRFTFLIFTQLSFLCVLAQSKIKSYEYWFDNDYNNKIITNITPADVYNLNTGISTSGLNAGLHTFNIYFADDSSNYSSIVSSYFYKSSSDVSGYEYWFDDNYSNKVSQSITPAQKLNLSPSVNVDALSSGYHIFNIRVKNADNSWSVVKSSYFIKLGKSGVREVITGYRYWFDNGRDTTEVNVTIGSPAPEVIITSGFNVQHLDTGYHWVYFQVKDTAQLWSSVISHDFYYGSLKITTNTLPLVRLNDSLNLPFNVVFGQPPYSWNIVRGAVPDDVVLNSNGVLTGIPREAKNSVFTVRVTDSLGNFAEKEFVLKVLVTLPISRFKINKTGSAAVPGRVLDYFISVENIGTTGDTAFTFEFLEPWFTYISSDSTCKVLSKQPDLFTTDPTDSIPLALEWKAFLNPGESRLMSYKVRLQPTFPIGKPVSGCACLTTAESEHCYAQQLECIIVKEVACGGGCAFLGPTGPGYIACLAACVAGVYYVCSRDYNYCIETEREDDNPSCSCDPKPSQAPVDPNEKLVNAKKFIQPNQLLVYPIHYENTGDVEAQDVFVWDTLDSDLDISTLKIITPGATLHSPSRTIKWNLVGRNLPPDSTDNVVYSIKPKPNLPSGTIIKNKASIQFEIFDTVITNEVVNIIDAVLPKSSMLPLPVISPIANFPISWAGIDSIGEIESYSIFVSENGEGFKPYLETSNTSDTFAGQAGKTYEFICIAKDVAGNVETKNTIAEAKTTVIYVSDSICWGGSTIMVSEKKGSSYRWQVDRELGYQNIGDSTYYSGTAKDTFRITTIPNTDFAHFKYRCIVTKSNGVKDTSITHHLQVVSIWTGAVDEAWETDNNWNCGRVPDENTDVFISNNSPRNPILNSDRSCRSITVSKEKKFTVKAGFVLTLTGKPGN